MTMRICFHLVILLSNSFQYMASIRVDDLFGTKTTYQAASLPWVNTDPILDQQESFQKHFQNFTSRDWPSFCSPVQINALIRHGIRNAGPKEIDRFEKLFERISSFIQNKNVSLHSSMNKLLNIIQETRPKYLLKEGEVEQMLLAQRIFQKYSDIFDDISSDDMLMVATTSPRTVESCQSFKTGLQQQLNSVEFNPDIQVNDTMLRFFDHCNRYIHEVENEKNSALEEYYRYVQSATFKEIAFSVSRRLGLPHDIYIQPKELKALYVMAALEVATLKTSDLTDLFDEFEIKKLEYSTDLKNYWKKSFGHEINYKQSCPLLVDILNHLNKAVKGEMFHRGIFRFAHAETVLPLQALLGLFKVDSPLRASNFHQHQDRTFRTSKIIPFSGNVVFVIFDCDTSGEEASVGGPWEKHMVQLLVNEKPTIIPGCEHEFCPYSALVELHKTITDSCEMERICSIKRDEL